MFFEFGSVVRRLDFSSSVKFFILYRNCILLIVPSLYICSNVGLLRMPVAFLSHFYQNVCCFCVLMCQSHFWHTRKYWAIKTLTATTQTGIPTAVWHYAADFVTTWPSMCQLITVSNYCSGTSPVICQYAWLQNLLVVTCGCVRKCMFAHWGSSSLKPYIVFCRNM
jgi:hypothetical protein